LQTNIFWTLSWPFSCDYNFWLRDLKFFLCIKDLINKTCWKNGKDLSNAAPKIKLWNHTKKTHFPVFAKNFRRPCKKLKIFFCQFPNPWTLRVSGMGGYTSKCEKKSKSLHPNVQYTLKSSTLLYNLEIFFCRHWDAGQCRKPTNDNRLIKLTLDYLHKNKPLDIMKTTHLRSGIYNNFRFNLNFVRLSLKVPKREIFGRSDFPDFSP
jgi:hypothetical protein